MFEFIVKENHLNDNSSHEFNNNNISYKFWHQRLEHTIKQITKWKINKYLMIYNLLISLYQLMNFMWTLYLWKQALLSFKTKDKSHSERLSSLYIVNSDLCSLIN